MKGKGEVALATSDSKFRIVIPKKIRKIMNFTTNKSFIMVAIDDSIVIKPLKSNMKDERIVKAAKEYTEAGF
jgi:AbrB family looped-hinge helix DNA binding protein